MWTRDKGVEAEHVRPAMQDCWTTVAIIPTQSTCCKEIIILFSMQSDAPLFVEILVDSLWPACGILALIALTF